MKCNGLDFIYKSSIYANSRTNLEARKGVSKVFIVAFRSGAVMGFLIAANGLFVLYITINLFKIYCSDDWEGLFESIIFFENMIMDFTLFLQLYTCERKVVHFVHVYKSRYTGVHKVDCLIGCFSFILVKYTYVL
ncbi:putative inorganic diphosphatase [Helianthus anomalus]